MRLGTVKAVSELLCWGCQAAQPWQEQCLLEYRHAKVVAPHPSRAFTSYVCSSCCPTSSLLICLFKLLQLVERQSPHGAQQLVHRQGFSYCTVTFTHYWQLFLPSISKRKKPPTLQVN